MAKVVKNHQERRFFNLCKKFIGTEKPKQGYYDIKFSPRRELFGIKWAYELTILASLPCVAVLVTTIFFSIFLSALTCEIIPIR